MIRTEAEYQDAVRRIDAELKRINEPRSRLIQSGLNEAEIKRVIDPLMSLHLQLQEEVECYQRIRRGDMPELANLAGLGQLLIAARIYLGLSQRELARRLGVDEYRVTRDERNAYHGISLERAQAILEALQVRAVTRIETPVRSQFNEAPG